MSWTFMLFRPFCEEPAEPGIGGGVLFSIVAEWGEFKLLAELGVIPAGGELLPLTG